MKAPKAAPAEQTPEGVYQSICLGPIHWGTQSGSYKGKPTKRNTLNVAFEILGVKKENGDAFVNYKTYTFSVGKKANLAKDIKAWLGIKNLEDFDFEGLAGKPAFVTISEKEAEDGSATYSNITNISALPKGTKILKGTLPTRSFFLDEAYTMDDFNALGDYDKNKISSSEEYPDWKAGADGGKKAKTAAKGKGKK